MTILVADDDQKWAGELAAWLTSRLDPNVKIEFERYGGEVINSVEKVAADVLILDVFFDTTDKYDATNEILPALRRKWPTLPVIIMSSFDSASTAGDSNRTETDEHMFTFPKELFLRDADRAIDSLCKLIRHVESGAPLSSASEVLP